MIQIQCKSNGCPYMHMTIMAANNITASYVTIAYKYKLKQPLYAKLCVVVVMLFAGQSVQGIKHFMSTTCVIYISLLLHQDPAMLPLQDIHM